MYTEKRIFDGGARGRDGKSDLPSGKMLYRIRLLPRARPAGNPILIESVFRGIGTGVVEHPSRESTWRAVIFNFLCDKNKKRVCYTFLEIFIFIPVFLSFRK